MKATHHRGSALLFAALLVFAATPAAAQQRAGAGAFAIEALGGTAGSAAGIGLGIVTFRPGSCDGEDVACILEKLGSIGLLTAITSPLGTWAAGRAANTEPDFVGALVGGVAGTLAGAGAIRLLDEAGSPVEGAGAVLVYCATQGIFSALGSRLRRAVRDAP